MKLITKTLLVVATVASTTTAGITQSYSIKHQKESIELLEELKQSSVNYDKLQTRYKKLSKRVTVEINRIMNLTDSIKHLDQSFKKEREQLSNKIVLAHNLNKRTNHFNSREKKSNLITLENKIAQTKNDIFLTKAKVMQVKESITRPFFVSTLTTSLMKKKTRGGYTETANHKKVDGFKTNIRILNNLNSNNNEINTVSFQLYNLYNKSINYTKDLTITFSENIKDISTIIEVDRKTIVSGDYKLIILIDGKEIKSSNIFIASR